MNRLEAIEQVLNVVDARAENIELNGLVQIMRTKLMFHQTIICNFIKDKPYSGGF